jgi:hypothetical protein
MFVALVTHWGALRVALIALAVASTVHVVSHTGDSDLGGRDSDLAGLIVVAVMFLIGAAMAPTREGRPQRAHRRQGGPT